MALIWRDEIEAGDPMAVVRQFDALYAEQTAAYNWTTVPYSQANFTAAGAMTWTVLSGDQITFDYVRINRVLWLSLVLTNTSIGGTPTATLRVRLPLGLTATKTRYVAANVNDNGTWKSGHFRVTAGSPFVEVLLLDTVTAFTASTRNTWVVGQLSCEAA